jgi:holo-[acyl-carrier protein] synthase
MIYTGIDLVEIDRIKRSIKNPRFLSRVFSPQELKFFAQRSFNPSTIAANFCAKEAFAKALGTGIRGFSLNEISVLRDRMGAPYILLTGKARELITARGLKLSISVSHTKNYATAVLVAYKC